eukprot:TRINITY_DN8274_c0_g1_i2.p1 TRINITY_DN8274_c0_g1~~TRINITY_DN8274_c0_g1_i2.p1  ORF type:complete len:560 (+),score=263.82 TRINITY_DN8274_c0_g1_i2:111-1790(+)
MAGRGASMGRGAGGRGAALNGPWAGGAGGRGAHGHVPASQQMGPPLPATKDRSVLEYMARRPHRGFCPDNLTGAVAHWTANKGKAISTVRAECDLKTPTPNDGSIEPAAASESPAKGVNVRAFLVGQLGSGRGQALGRISVIAKSHRPEGTTQQVTEAYGGPATGTTDKALTTALQKHLKQQAGVDLSKVKSWNKLVELKYEGGKSTVFFAPALHEAGGELEFKHQSNAKTEEKEVPEVYSEEEEVEVEIEVEEDGKKTKQKEKQMKKVKKTRKVKKEVTTQIPVVSPTRRTLQMLRGTQIGATTHQGFAELCAAGDAFDEWLQTDAAAAVIPVLERRTEEAEKVEAERKKAREAQEERKRKRDEAFGEVQKEHDEKIKALKEQWADDDEGMTDEEKRLAMKDRNQQRTEVQKEMQAKRKEVEQKLAEEEKAKKEAEEPAAKKPRVRIVFEKNQEEIDLFQLLDRPLSNGQQNQGLLDRKDLAHKLLCVAGGPSTFKQAMHHATLGGTNKLGPLNYELLCREKKEVEIPEPKEPSPKKEASPKKDASPKKSPKKAEALD